MGLFGPTQAAFAKVRIIAGDRCDNLVRETCQRRHGAQTKDSTGSVHSGRVVTLQEDEARRKVDAAAKPEAARIVANWQSRGIYEARLKALGLDRDPACSGQNGLENRSCRQRLMDVTEVLLRSHAKFGWVTPIDRAVPELQNVDLAGIHGLTEDQRFRFSSDLIADQISREIRDPNLDSKLAKQMEEVRENLAAVIAEKIPDSQAREAMLAKLRAVKFAGSDCRAEKRNLSTTFTFNALYYPTQNTVKVCKGYQMANDSKYFLASVLGHELGHAIDPCRTPLAPRTLGEKLTWRAADMSSQAAAESELPTADLVKCLRSWKSIGAKRLSPFSTDRGKGLCSNDQINESVADWFGVEALARMVKKQSFGKQSPDEVAAGVANVFADSCYAGSNQSENQIHPASRLRLEKILAVQPDIRKAMGCNPLRENQRYCANTPDENPAPPAQGQEGRK